MAIGGSVSSVFDCPRCGVALSEVGVRVGVTCGVAGSTSASGAAMKRHVRTTRAVRSICTRIAPTQCCRAGPMWRDSRGRELKRPAVLLLLLLLL